MNQREVIESILSRGEEFITSSSQNMINSPLKKDAVVLTSRRFIIIRPKLFGRMDLEDMLWQDVKDIQLSQGFLGSTLTCIGEDEGIQLEGIEKAEARRCYSEAQRLEEVWREKQRQRQMEEDRAKAGGVYLDAGAGRANSPAQSSVEERLERLQALHKKGLVSDAEYEAKKAALIQEL